MNKYFVVSDVHGFYNEMISALTENGFDKNNPEHIFVSCGDLFDRGRQPRECLDFVLSLPRERRILIRGNHEDLLDNIMKFHTYNSYDHSNGTIDTIKRLTKKQFVDDSAISKLSSDKKVTEYYNSLVNYHETDKFIFVHSWYPLVDYNWRQATREDWNYARWGNPYDKWSLLPIEKDLGNKTIVVGHWHTSYAHSKFHHIGKEFPGKNEKVEEVCCFDPFVDHQIIGLDACTALTKKVNCVVLDIYKNY